MSDFQPGDMLIQFGRGSRGVESMPADEFRLEIALFELQAIREEARADTFSLTLMQCTQPFVSKFECAQFKLIGELFAIYSPVWQFAINWKAPLTDVAQDDSSIKVHRYYSWREQLSSWMTRIWLDDLCQRVPLGCFTGNETLSACIRYFLQTKGGRYPEIAWISDADCKWKFCIYPEDELPNRLESLVRPTSQISYPEPEVRRQIGQASIIHDPFIESVDIPCQPGVLFADGSSAEVEPLNGSTIVTLLDQLQDTDWSCDTRFISIFQEVSRFSPLLAYLALYGHPLGILGEVVLLNLKREDHYSAFSPVLSLVASEQMVRVWVGMHYRRVSLNHLLQHEQATALVEDFLRHPSRLSPRFQWQSELDAWPTRIRPEDDIFDPLEPLTRPASQSPVPVEELRERLKASYIHVGLPTTAIRFG